MKNYPITIPIMIVAVLAIAWGFIVFSSPPQEPGDSPVTYPQVQDGPVIYERINMENLKPGDTYYREDGTRVTVGYESLKLLTGDHNIAISREAPALIMNVSAYCICEICCRGFADGFTASGKPAVGRICAAPSEYAFGTVFDVEGYGEWVCQDRGGAIKGDKLDLLMDSHGKAKLFGRQWLKVRMVRNEQR